VRTGTTELYEDLALQAGYFARRSPVYARVLAGVQALLDGGGGLRERLEAAWHERGFPAIYDRPLLLVAVLREDALYQGRSHPLYRALVEAAPQPEAASAEAVAAALDPRRQRVWAQLGRRSVQTNDTGRAVVWMWPAALAGCAEGARPLALVDLGASAGLNLLADQLPPLWRDADGQPLEVVRSPRVVARLGLDRQPVDLGDPDEVRWMEACLWAGETHRIERLEAALHAARIHGAPTVERHDASAFSARVAALSRELAPGTLLVAYQSILRDYLPEPVRVAYQEGMRAWLAATPPGAAAWLELEAVDHADRRWPCAITAHLPGGSLVLGRCGYHPDEVRVDAAAAAAFAERLLPGTADRR
jgi:hypothetical protein